MRFEHRAPSGSFGLLTETPMPNPYLPTETLDHTVDLLQNDADTLEQCCLVSKSWVPRTRRHLFANIKFHRPSDLERWKERFPDAANSPAYYTRTLLVHCSHPITASGTEDGDWIRAFSRVRRLDMNNGKQFLGASGVSLAPFHKFSPTLKSLHVGFTLIPHSGIFDLICSFPLLEDLSLEGHDRWFGGDDPRESQTVTRLISPALTGSLDFHTLGVVGKIARQLLDLPNGLHFRTLTLSWNQKTDLSWITELVVKCSHTLESLDIAYAPGRTFVCICTPIRSLTLSQVWTFSPSGSFDLSKATKLRDLVFRSGWRTAEWITPTLQTITPEHQELQQISICVPSWLGSYGSKIKQSLGEAALGRWLDLDRLLLQFWEVHLVLPKVECASMEGQEQIAKDCIGCLFPEVTKSGVVDLGR